MQIFHFLFIFKTHNIHFKIVIFIFFWKLLLFCHSSTFRWYDQTDLSFSFTCNCDTQYSICQLQCSTEVVLIFIWQFTNHINPNHIIYNPSCEQVYMYKYKLHCYSSQTQISSDPPSYIFLTTIIVAVITV